MTEEIESFYNDLKSFYFEIVRIRTKTVSTQEFKEKTIDTYSVWKTKIEPSLSTKIEKDALSDLNHLFEGLYQEARIRVADVSNVQTLIAQIHDMFLKEVVAPLRRMKFSEPEASLMESAKFLGLDTNWSSATSALQLQEVVITLVAKRKGIRLDKSSVEKLLGKKIQNFSFNHQYAAFSEHVKDFIEMPILAKHLRKMRVKVLHEGYNPKPEETQSIVSFTIGLLGKLEKIYDMR